MGASLQGQQLLQLMAELHTCVHFSVITRVEDCRSSLGRKTVKIILCIFSKYLMNSLVPIYVYVCVCVCVCVYNKW